MKNDRRPFFVTLLALGVLPITVLNTVRFVFALAKWNLLASFMPQPGPFYIAATGLVWTLGWLTVYIGLWLGLKWARPVMFATTGLYIAYYWIDRLAYQSAVARSNEPFALSATFVFLLVTAFVLFLPGSRKFFK